MKGIEAKSRVINHQQMKKLIDFLDCIDIIKKDDGVYIHYKENVCEVFNGHLVQLVNGISITSANTIHLNPEITYTKENNINTIVKRTKESETSRKSKLIGTKNHN